MRRLLLLAIVTAAAHSAAAQEIPSGWAPPATIPGQAVTLPDGLKVKGWSTTGPVPVSKPPQPFDDPGKTQVGEVNVLTGKNPPLRNKQGDPFDLRGTGLPRRP